MEQEICQECGSKILKIEIDSLLFPAKNISYKCCCGCQVYKNKKRENKNQEESSNATRNRKSDDLSRVRRIS